jgi:hypothetical protein
MIVSGAASNVLIFLKLNSNQVKFVYFFILDQINTIHTILIHCSPPPIHFPLVFFRSIVMIGNALIHPIYNHMFPLLIPLLFLLDHNVGCTRLPSLTEYRRTVSLR